jgi:hypothetical protein
MGLASFMFSGSMNNIGEFDNDRVKINVIRTMATRSLFINGV